jgi:hypothetical protein
MRDAHRAGRESRRAAVELGRKLSAEAEGPVAEPRSGGPSDRGPVRIGVLAATLKREADAEDRPHPALAGGPLGAEAVGARAAERPARMNDGDVKAAAVSPGSFRTHRSEARRIRDHPGRVAQRGMACHLLSAPQATAGPGGAHNRLRRSSASGFWHYRLRRRERSMRLTPPHRTKCANATRDPSAR